VASKKAAVAISYQSHRYVQTPVLSSTDAGAAVGATPLVPVTIARAAVAADNRLTTKRLWRTPASPPSTSMGRGPAWPVVDNMALSHALLIEGNNRIRGTDQSCKESWARVLKAWMHLLRKQKDARARAVREKSGIDVIRKQLPKMVAGAMEFSSCIVQARLPKPTCISLHADLLNCADGLHCGTHVFGRIRGEHADDVPRVKNTKSLKTCVVPSSTILGEAQKPRPVQVGGRRSFRPA